MEKDERDENPFWHSDQIIHFLKSLWITLAMFWNAMRPGVQQPNIVTSSGLWTLRTPPTDTNWQSCTNTTSQENQQLTLLTFKMSSFERFLLPLKYSLTPLFFMQYIFYILAEWYLTSSCVAKSTDNTFCMNMTEDCSNRSWLFYFFTWKDLVFISNNNGNVW